MSFSKSHTLTALFLVTTALPALADEVVMDDLIVERKMCVGSGNCTDGEIFGSADLKIEDDTPELHLVESGTNGADWSISNNLQSAGSQNAFSINNIGDDISPFVIEDGAPDNTMYISSNGNVGLGTSLPFADLHIMQDVGPAILRLESYSNFFDRWDAYDLYAQEAGFHIVERDTNNRPFFVKRLAPHDSFRIQENGNVGIGGPPQAPLELIRSDSFNFFRITATGAAVNESVDFVFTEGPLGTGQLRYNIVETGDSPQVPEMTLDADGNMTLTGTLTTTGPTCAAGCDRVFNADFALQGIEERAEEMFAMGHLPALGPTHPGQPLNVGEKLGQVINELEHAHIYIAQQQAVIAEQQSVLTQVLARLETLEAE